MKRKFLSAALAAVLFCVLLAGCNTNGENASTPSGAGATDNVILGEYKGIEVEVQLLTATDEDIESKMNSNIAASSFQNVTDRAVQNDDIANIDFVGKVDGVAFEGGAATGHDLEIGSGSFIPGFEEQVIGLTIGQSSDITITFPEEYPQNPDLAGKDAVFTVTVNSIKVKSVPDEITDTLISELFPGYTTVDEYKAHLKEQMESENEQSNSNAKQSAVWEKVWEDCEVKQIPSDRIEEYIDINLEDYMSYLEANGAEASEEKAREELKEYADNDIGINLVVEAIAEKEGLSVDDEEVNVYIEDQTAAGYVAAEEMQKYKPLIKSNLLFEKVLNFLVDNAVFKTV